MKEFSERIAREIGLKVWAVENVLRLIGEDCSVAFIARYRKEATDCMNEVMISRVKKRSEELSLLESRRKTIIESIDKQGLLTNELKSDIKKAETLSELEDLYLPFKPKRKTRAEIAKQKGLQPLADLILKEADCDIDKRAKEFVALSKQVGSVQEALEGARDIVAANINENASIRSAMREYFKRHATICATETKNSKNKTAFHDDKTPFQSDKTAFCKNETPSYKNEYALAAPSHRILAYFREEKAGNIRLSIKPSDDEKAEDFLVARCVRRKKSGSCSNQKELAARDCYKRLLEPSLQTELRNELKDKADKVAVEVFAKNLRQLLLSPPLGEKRVLAIDPGFRTGCKCVCLDAQGKLLYHNVIYLSQSEKAKEQLSVWVKQFDVQAIAIGNGTASKETLKLVKEANLDTKPIISMVNEDGASVYSASDIAIEELGDYDITVRGAVSIGRRMQDPLAELIKIDPKSIGVGQYQHDVNQALLEESLNNQVISCVNSVGVELNTASPKLLSYVSGIGSSLAKNIVEYRNTHGAFRSRKELLQVKRFGAKAFEQTAGFLRVKASDNPLDTTAVHPERYSLVEQMAKDAHCTVKELIEHKDARNNVKIERYISKDCGLPTLNDIMQELANHGRESRTMFSEQEYDNSIDTIEQLYVNQWLYGRVSNITAFGAFIDLGVHTDGLLHISNISEDFVSDVNDVLQIGQRIKVRVSEVDYLKKRISLSMLPETNEKTKSIKSKMKQ
ncbi:MAG: Tex family protein [Candidatus Onthomorpha sp.]|nr:RNA-binding transcriptional accessory protein [Bacteroidales bacterium]MDD7485658.1 Tex family protein [Bacteroidales bacterium]MDY5698607.1 Tex family protein [Candidatus Onthomorpha sp.]